MPTSTRVHPDSRKTEKPPVYQENIPEPTSREQLLKYWMPLSLDERTANKLLWLTEGGSKVLRLNDEVCPYLDRPERYEHSPQVLCKECVWESRGYWEVECCGWVMVGVAYESETRRSTGGPCGLGENPGSWSLGWSGSCYHAWHDGDKWEVQEPQSATIGVYVDQPAGLIAFYALQRDGDATRTRLLHRFSTPLKDKVLPGFWVGRKSSCQLLQKQD